MFSGMTSIIKDVFILRALAELMHFARVLRFQNH